MTVRVHHPPTMPERRAPTTPVGMCAVGIEDKPAALHFRGAQGGAAGARHLCGIERQVHVFGGVAVEIKNTERAATRREIPQLDRYSIHIVCNHRPRS